MKNTFTLLSFIVCFILLPAGTLYAQCPGGYSQAELNWDNLDFLPSNNVRYTAYYPSAAFPYTQNFTMGTRTVNFAMAPTNTITLNGENGVNTAHAGSFATAGDDVQFTTTSTANNTITLTFDAEVANVMFSLFDLDANQRVNVTATDAPGVAQTITIARATGTSGITLAGSGTTSATASAPLTAYGNNDNRGTINVTVSGPVKKIVVTLYNAAGDIWLSDIDACVTGSFPINYQQVSRPFTGQPQYVLTVVNNNIYYVDPANGNSYFLFNEPGHNRLNSMAYDPYRRRVFYTYSLTGGNNPPTDKALKMYDVDSKTISIAIPNVNTFGIPAYESGVESGAASFYNGSLYLGIEGYTGSDNSGSPYAARRKSTIWKIDFDAAGNPLAPAAQVFGVTADDGVHAQNIHDWSDFGITDGMLVDFNGSQSGNIDYSHFDMMTGVTTKFTPVGPTIPRQVSIGWDEKLYDVDVSIAQYNGTNGVGTAFNMFAPLGPAIPVGSTAVASWGDAAGPYRPFLDFGDAPASYDPDPLSPACHDTLTPNAGGRRTKLILGPDEDLEWLKKGFTTVEDDFEDGISFVPIFSPALGSYQVQVTAFNNTGTNATVCGWLDFDGNGLFDPGEGTAAINIPSAAAPQTFWLNWPGTPSTLPFGSYTYLRIRITSASFGMTKNNSTGYYSTGEVEDYRVLVDKVLPLDILTFEASLTDQSTVKLNWSANEDVNTSGYEVQRSINGRDWEQVIYQDAARANGFKTYEVFDNNPRKGVSQYRVKMNGSNGEYKYSNIRIIKISLPEWVTIYPNPATDHAMLLINAATEGQIAHISVLDAKGSRLFYNKAILSAGANSLRIPFGTDWAQGMYIIRVNMGGKIVNKKLIIRP